MDIQIFGEPELAVRGQLDASGEIALVLLGKAKLAGRSAEDASDFVRDLYEKDFLVNPVVTLQVIGVAQNRFTILGQVKSPGVYTFGISEKLNILQAIARAGGYTRIGEPSRVLVRRTLHGKESTIRLNAKAIAKDADIELFQIQSEDIITVGETVF